MYVPVDSKDAYQAAPEWKDFTNIVEKDFTGIDVIRNEKQLTIYPNPTSGRVKLVFDPFPSEGILLTITNITGETIQKQFIQEKEEWIDLSGNIPGIYFINTNLKGAKVQKLILK